MVWLTYGDLVIFIAGNEEHAEFALIEVARSLGQMMQSVTKAEIAEKALLDHYAKILLYLDEMITPAGQVQHLVYSEMRKMVKMDLHDT